jgi:hypothetical protein
LAAAIADVAMLTETAVDLRKDLLFMLVLLELAKAPL